MDISNAKVGLTGATGTMGMASLFKLKEKNALSGIRVLARDTKTNRKKLRPFISLGLEIVWGDLMDKKSIASLVAGTRMVIHMGGLVSPAADYYPEKTLKVNIQSARNIVEAIEIAGQKDKTALIYIGSVAQYGPRNVPNHWIAEGDHMHPAEGDAYALSKVAAERIVAESGLSRWASLRQTGILSEALVAKGTDPITFHTPVNGVLEWATAEDSGSLIAALVTREIPENFWKRFYNIGGGESYRMTNYEFEKAFLRAISCPPPEKVFDAAWFSLDNFHGGWFADSDLLEQMIPFRQGSSSDMYFKEMASRMPWFFKLASIVPASAIKMFMHHVACHPTHGTLGWIKSNNSERIRLHYGSLENYKAITGWDGFVTPHPSSNPILADIGFDRTKPISKLDIEDMKSVAKSNGGECMSTEMEIGDLDTPIKWRANDGTEFEATPRVIALGGHWKPLI